MTTFTVFLTAVWALTRILLMGVIYMLTNLLGMIRVLL